MSLPSWVPDWSRSVSICDLRHLDEKHPYTHFCASKDSTPCPLFNRLRSLGLNGFLHDSILECGGVLSDPGQHEINSTFSIFLGSYARAHDFHTTLQGWKRICETYASPQYLQDESKLDAFLKTLTGGDESVHYKIMKKQFLDWDRSNWYIRLLCRFSIPTSIFLRVLLLLCLQIVAVAQRFLRNRSLTAPDIYTAYNRRMATAKNGYIGLVPFGTQPDDKIGLFKGGKMPLIIRREGESWRLIGDCYIHGIMKGEAWEEVKCETMWFL